MAEQAGEGKAAGKAILFGEHAVVHGVPALVVGLDRGVTARATRAAGPGSSLVINGGDAVTVERGSELGQALGALVAASGVGPGDPGFVVEATSELPMGAGLGSSAAIGVAVARAVAQVLGREATLDEVLERALAWERVFHGNPSGVDTAASARGGCLLYTRGQTPEPVRLRHPLTIAIGVSGPSPSTRSMVESVARMRDRRPDAFAQQLDAVRSLVGNARLALEEGDLRSVGKFMDLNQMILAGWMLSTSAIEELCGLAREAGALGAKLTGGGGGGCVVVLCDGDAEGVLGAWRRAGYQGFSAHVQA